MQAISLTEADRSWVADVWKRLEAKMPFALQKAQGLDFMPYTVRDNSWQPGPGGICWWTNGFWPAEMWQMYLHTGDECYKAEAERTEVMLDTAFADYDNIHHDVGFMWHITAGVNFRLTGNDKSRKRALLAANLLAGRFNPLGFIRAWNQDRIGWAIVDSMLNINLLYWASDFLGDPRYRKIAMIHADTTMEHFVRPDGSVNHIVQFDPETMAVLGTPGGQGCAPGSSWSRGQAWALYGFTLSFMHTGKQAYLDTAKRVAHYFIACVQNDWIPCCDFRQPDFPDLRDNCAGSIAACAFIELAKNVPEGESALYLNAAIQLLKAADVQCADWGLENPAILQKCTGAYHNPGEHHMAMTYGDYFFIEAMGKLRGEKLLFW